MSIADPLTHEEPWWTHITLNPQHPVMVRESMIRFLRNLLARGLPSARGRIIVSGMPKSGTTAIAMLMGAAARLPVNSDPFSRMDEAGIQFRDALYSGSSDLSELIQSYGQFFRGDLIKDPNFIFFADAVREIFPSAPFVIVIRDPRDNIRSILNRLNLPGRIQQEPPPYQGINPTWQRILEGRTPDVPGSNYVQRIAERWALASRLYLERADWMIPVKYEAFKAAKEKTVSETLRNLGFARLKPIDHLVDRQFQPKGDHTVTWEEFFGLKGLETIEAVCGAEMRQLGYPPRRFQA